MQKGPRHKTGRGLFRARMLQAQHGPQTSRQEFTVKTFGNKSRPRRVAADDSRASFSECRLIGSLRC
jgi:hypothetical protein